MNVIHVIGSYALVLSLSTVGISAARSDAADAAMKGDGTALRAVLQRKADVNAPQADGATALHWAVYRNDLEMADVLIRAGADPRAANRDGATVLSLACINGNSAMIEKLLNSGASANERGPNGETALMMASRTGNVDAIRLLLDRGAEVNAKENLRGTTALMWAAAQANAPAVQLLVERGADAGARSNAVAKGRTAYLAPTPAERARSGDSAGSRRGGGGTQSATPAVDQDLAERVAFLRRDQDLDGGGLTALVFAARQGDLESARILLAAKADVNQITQYGWTPLLTATQNRNYKLASFLLDNGADPNLANKGGWTPLYLATDNRNIEKGDYPTRQPDVDHLEFIKKLLKNGANVNTRAKDSTETRTIFTHQWLYEDGATPFLRAAQSGDVTLMKLLLQHGADPNIATTNKTTPLMAAAGIGWVEGVTFESSAKENLEAVKLLLDLGADVNAVDGDGRTALHGAAHKGRTEVVQILADHGARLDARDVGSRDTIAGELVGHTWQPLDYAEGLVRVGVQSAVAHPETAALIRKLMTERGLPVPPEGRTLQSICVVEICK
jgi:ankyrin repeat protein